MYVDGVAFEYKSNPCEHAKCLKQKQWRTIREGLHFGCTARGNKEGKNYVQFMVGMAYNRGVVMCVPLQQKMIGEYYSQLVETEISPVLDSMDGCSRKILQDGCPCQNSRKAFGMMEQQNIAVFAIPTRSPDLNPLENFFNQVKYQLRLISFCV